MPNLIKNGPVVPEKKMLKHDARRTTDDDGRQPIAIGHLCYSGDLIKINDNQDLYSFPANTANIKT